MIQPTVFLQPNNKEQLDLTVYTDADWAGCQVTRKSTSGFVIQFLGTTVHFGSRTQSVVALSSAESEFYAIGTGATEALHLKNFLGEILHNKISLKIHTDSTSGKSMATRIGVSKRAKHIELKYMFIQHLIHDGILSIHKINTKHNPSDLLTKYVQREVLQWHLHAAGIRPPDNWESSYSSFTHQHTNTTSVHVSAAYLIEYIMYTYVYLKGYMVIVIQFGTYMITSSFTTSFTPRVTWWFSLQFFLQYKFCSDTFSTLQNMAHKGYYASLWIGWGSYSSTATPVAMCGTSTFPWKYNMFWADQRLTQYMQLWLWHYIMQARHCPDTCPLMYSMDCCSTQLSSPYTWRRTSMRMKILVHKIHGTSYRPRFQNLQLQLHCQELHPRPPWVHPDLQRWRALQGWICEVHGWILLQFSYNGFWLHVSNSAWIHPSDTILATRCLHINTALRFRSMYRIFEGKVLYRWLMSYMI